MNQAIFQQIEDVIQTIPHEVVNESRHTFTFNRMYRAYMSEDSKKNIPKVFGSSIWWRVKKYAKKMRKKNNLPKQISLSLPKDSIIFVRPEKLGVIALSYDRQLNVKVFLNQNFRFMLQYEVEALMALKGLGFAPELKASNLEKQWLITDCSFNTEPLLRKNRPEYYMFNHFESMLLPKMDQFYQRTIYLRENFNEWSLRAQERISKHPSSEYLRRCLEHLDQEDIDRATPFLLSSFLHFDLHAGNVLNHQGKITIVDWEGGAKGLTLMDFFYMSKRIIKTHRELRKQFVKHESDLEVVSKMNQVFQQWLKTSQKIELEKPLSNKAFSQISLLEQLLVLWEDRQIDMIKEIGGFEQEVFTSL